MSFTRIDHYEKEYADTHHDTALNVTQGVEEQPIVSPYFKRRKKRALSTGEYVEGILAGNITTLSQAITLVESSNPDHYAQAQEIIEACLPHAGKSVRIGITGVPGAGKSTFIEAIGNMVAGLRHKLAVLAIDPSSERSGGSILGDKTRMESICNNPSVFVRPSPSAGSLGGVARKTRETIVLCEAAGFDVIFIETVGVGQSETAVHSMVDLFMLLQISGAGDELQGIKRGIMEMADGIVIQNAATRALHNGMSLRLLFEQLHDIRRDVRIPLVFMGYLNPIMQFGFEAFCQKCVECGIDGVIIPDLPFRDYEESYKAIALKYDIRVIMLITPETSEARVREIDAHTDGFIYLVSSAATTGAQKDFDTRKQAYFKKIEDMNLRNPRMVGFGISNKQTFDAACAHSSGAIIGSRFVTLLNEKEGDAEKAIRQLKEDLKQ